MFVNPLKTTTDLHVLKYNSDLRNKRRGMEEAEGNSWWRKIKMKMNEKGGLRRRVRIRRKKVATLYLLENEGFHSGKDEGNITKAAQRRDSNSAWLSVTTLISFPIR